MLFAVLFTDAADADPDIRKTHMSAHLAFLAKHAGQISAAGPLWTSDNSSAGGLWLVDADSAEDVEKLVQADPFWPTGLRDQIRCAFSDGNGCLQMANR